MFASAVAIVFWPGKMSADTLVQITQVRAGDYTNWHAGLLMVLWRPFWLIGVGPGWVTWMALVTFSLGLYGVLRAGFGRWGAAVGAAIIIALPQVLGYVGYLGRDMWFTAFFLAAGAGLLVVDKSAGRARNLSAAGCLVAVWLMLAARQNALPAAAVLLAALVLRCWPASLLRQSARRVGWRSRLIRLVGPVAVATVLALGLVGSQAVARRTFGVKSTHIEQGIFLYDLAALSHEEGEVLLDPEIFPSQDLAIIDRAFREAALPLDALIFGSGAAILFPVPDARVDELRDDWLAAIKENPLSYAEERLALWSEQIALTGPTLWVFHPGIDENPWGYTAEYPALSDAANEYLRFFAANDALDGGLVHEVWLYLLVTLGGLAYFRSRQSSRRVVAWMCLASVAYQFGVFLGAMGVGYRLAFPSVVVGLAVGAVGASDIAVHLRIHRAERRSAISSGPETGADATRRDGISPCLPAPDGLT